LVEDENKKRSANKEFLLRKAAYKWAHYYGKEIHKRKNPSQQTSKNQVYTKIKQSGQLFAGLEISARSPFLHRKDSPPFQESEQGHQKQANHSSQRIIKPKPKSRKTFSESYVDSSATPPAHEETSEGTLITRNLQQTLINTSLSQWNARSVHNNNKVNYIQSIPGDLVTLQEIWNQAENVEKAGDVLNLFEREGRRGGGTATISRISANPSKISLEQRFRGSRSFLWLISLKRHNLQDTKIICSTP